MLLILDLLKESPKNKTYSLYIDSPDGGFMGERLISIQQIQDHPRSMIITIHELDGITWYNMV